VGDAVIFPDNRVRENLRPHLFWAVPVFLQRRTRNCHIGNNPSDNQGRFCTCFREAVLRAVNLGDDADTTGAVCGQLARQAGRDDSGVLAGVQ